MKDKNKVKNDETMPSKGKIVGAWLLLIILIACTSGLVYLKNNYKLEENTEEENIQTDSPITIALTDIATRFNNNILINQYKQEGLTLTANVTEKTIVISYVKAEITGNAKYTYNIEKSSIITTFSNQDKEINDKIFKVLVLACREKLGLTEDVNSKLDEFINDNTEAPGLKKEISENNITYSIDVRYPLSDSTSNNTTNTNTNTNESTEENNTENSTNTNSNDTTDNTTNTKENNNSTNETTPEENTFTEATPVR